jgi:glycine oxidase
VKSWDVVIIGSGIIGISLALNLRKHGASVLIVDKSEPGREASHAAAGMLAHCEQPEALRELACASAKLYPEFVQEVEDESGMKVDYRTDGTVLLRFGPEDEPSCPDALHLAPETLAELEPNLDPSSHSAVFLPEACVDPRALVAALLKAVRHRGVDFSSGDAVTQIDFHLFPAPSVVGVTTTKTRFPARTVVNCAGAWSGQFGPRFAPPTRPVKGQMLDVIPAEKLTSHQHESPPLLRHVIRAPEVYLVPRSDGRVVIGATVEEAGFDKRVNPDTIQMLFHAAAKVCPELSKARIHETWTGLRPGSPDNLPMLGAGETPGYYVATGHFRDGILLAPITAHVMTQVIQSQQPDVDLSAFSPLRFN